MNPGISLLKFAPLEQDQAFGPLRTMDSFIFLEPLTLLTSQVPRLPSAFTALIVSGGPIGLVSVYQTALQLNPRNKIDDDNLLTIVELLSGVKLNSVLANANSNSEGNDGFLDIDEVAGLQYQSVLTYAKLNSGGIKKNLTDYGNLDVGLTMKSNLYSPHAANSNLVDRDSSGSDLGIILISDHLIIDRYSNSDDSDNCVVDGAKPSLAADCPRSASLSYEFATHQASRLQADTKLIQRSASYVGLNVMKEVEDEGMDTFVRGNDDHDVEIRFTKRSHSPAVSCNNSASDSNVSVLQLQESQHDSAQYPLSLVTACFKHSDLRNSPLPKHHHQQRVTKSFRHMGSRTPAPTELASAASITLESKDLEEP
ncbi:hypothetical protein B7463_g5144, partial [Scytalidium lignicola]